MDYSRMIIDLLKGILSGRDIKNDTIITILSLAKEIDRRKVHGENIEDIEALYNDALWIKSEIIK